ncbi:YibE/F family protein [Corynebacterium timonense]|uniref:YibE/F-like protein n=1 Tax=Corynebacterium timonense TaxID=441500 RepID=A0A1H1LTU8_9CORY|nr:YibE/F family protein [Corynebacterium timonense]SDR78048.1 YibE/F-like protein [Corynebacterium timonense]
MGRHHASSTREPGDNTAARMTLAGALAAALILTIVGLVLLWPRGEAPDPEPGFRESQAVAATAYEAEVTSVFETGCDASVAGRVFGDTSAPGTPSGTECTTSVVRILEGPDASMNTMLQTAGRPDEPDLEEGQRVLLTRGEHADGGAHYTFLDMERTVPLAAWLAAAALAVIIIGGWRGVRALVGLGFTLLLLFVFLVPALLRGGPPVTLAVVSGAAILFPVLFLVHGWNWKAASALGGTLVALVAAAGLARAAIGTTQVRGLGEDSNLLIQLYLPGVSVAGLMLAGFIIGTLGALNDATVAQSSTVAELAEANPAARPLELFTAAMRVGRDHIASMVYTLVLAYIGAALPMTLLLAVVDRPLGQILTSDVVATELLRSVAGALGLALAVPVTTLFAAFTARGRAGAAASP